MRKVSFSEDSSKTFFTTETRVRRVNGGFTLIELMVVLAVMITLVSLSFLAMHGLKSAADFTKAENDLMDTITFARSYAMANNTYVYVGFGEFDSAQLPSEIPQNTGFGRVAVSVVASLDGTSGYDSSSSSSAASVWTSGYNNGSNLVELRKVQVFNGLHLASSLGTAASGGMVRPQLNEQWIVGSPSFASQISFYHPLPSEGAMFQFSKVIQFNSQGTASVVTNSGNEINQWLEIDLQPGHGNAAPPPPLSPEAGEIAAIMINGSTGAPRLYHP